MISGRSRTNIILCRLHEILLDHGWRFLRANTFSSHEDHEKFHLAATTKDKQRLKHINRVSSFVFLGKPIKMKAVISFFIASILSVHSFSQNWTRLNDVAKHKGDTVNIIGFVASTQFKASSKNACTLMTVKMNNSKDLIRLLVLNSDRENFAEAPETAYLNQYVQIIGKVELYKGMPQIILHSDRQISITREGPPEQE